MTIVELLDTTDHRPWPIPNEPWKFYQEWNDALFLHWQVELEELKKFVHPNLEIDLFDEKPWVSLVAFNMEKMRPKNLPYVSAISNFPEINIRTYVKYKGKQGVHFLSIEGAKSLSCKLAKNISELPYRHSIMKRTRDRFTSFNNKCNDTLEVEYSIETLSGKKNEIDLWLTERYALFQNADSYINEFEIHHIEWPVKRLNLNSINVDYPRFQQLINNSPDLTHYSQGVQVIAWGKKRHEIAITAP